VDHLTAGAIARLLDTAGEERFLRKATDFEQNMEQREGGESLYQGMMGALGYSKNKLTFLKLAKRVPLRSLEAITRSVKSYQECLAQTQALLLGTAGLLPSQRQHWHKGREPDNEWIDKLERLWASSCQPQAMSPADWHLFKVRPNNSPVRRIAAMSYLVIRHREKGFSEQIIDMVKEAADNRSHRTLEKGLLVAADGYWASHYDFGAVCRLENPTLLGEGRATEIIINIILPFAFAWSRLIAQPELGGKALDLYSIYPRLSLNSVERHMMSQLGLNKSAVNSARCQQGLIHIYNTLCTQGRCEQCVLTHP